jgi:hypothetical protein
MAGRANKAWPLCGLRGKAVGKKEQTEMQDVSEQGQGAQTPTDRRIVYTYFVRIGDAVKIGICVYPQQRMRELGFPECLLYFVTHEYGMACRLEKELHALFGLVLNCVGQNNSNR